MLSRMLRAVLLSQGLIGALLGWLIARSVGWSNWLALASAVLLPLATMKLSILATALMSRSPGAPALWWRSLVGENLATARVLFLQLAWSWSAPVFKPAIGAPSRVPVVLVHGYLCNHRIWDALTERLRRAGHPVQEVDLEPIFTSIENYVPLVNQAVESLRRQTSAAQVALVGHSMGGLAIRAWMRAHGTAHVARVLTLGTPHQGTQIVHPYSTPNGRQMVWQSDWLRELAASEPASTRQLMRIALTPQDNIVFPQREQGLQGVPVSEFEGLGHVELCTDGAVATWVLEQLGDLPL